MRNLPFVLAPALFGGCLYLKPSNGGGEKPAADRRAPTVADVAVPDGYEIEVIATGLTFPTGVTFDDDGRPYVVESGYSYGEVFTTPRLLRVDEATGALDVVAVGERPGWMGVAYADGAFFVAEAGVTSPGRVVRIDRDGQQTVLVDDLPSQGDHHVNGPVVRGGHVYFGVGTATNSGVVGPDNAEMGWLARAPRFHDVPCEDVVLAGTNFTAPDGTTTGAYVPYGTPTTAGQVVPGRVPCSGAILRAPIGGGPVELVAWGFRNPFGLAFDDDGALWATDNAYDDRGLRPIYGAADQLFRVVPGGWYGWPEHADGRRVHHARYSPREAVPGNAAPARILAEMPAAPIPPAALFAVHSSSNGLDFARGDAFGFAGEAFVAQFGDQAPVVGKVWAPVGFKVVRVDPKTGSIRDFAANKGKSNGPASRLGGGGLERPVAVRFSPDGARLYVVDFGVLAMDGHGAKPVAGTGALWRIARSGAPVALSGGAR